MLARNCDCFQSWAHTWQTRCVTCQDTALPMAKSACLHSRDCLCISLRLQGSLGWRLLFGVAVLPAAAVLVVVPWLYETPHRWAVAAACHQATAKQIAEMSPDGHEQTQLSQLVGDIMAP
jgi:hypothetical protein